MLKLRQKVNVGQTPLIATEGDRIRIDLTQISVDINEIDHQSQSTDAGQMLYGDFLEGFDMPGEDGFEDWLREQRSFLRERTINGHATASNVDASANGRGSMSALMFDQRPSLAILPFANQTRDDDGYVTDGLSEELIDAVSRLRWLPVIAASSTFAYRNESLNPKSAAETLGVRYVLEGRLSGEAGSFVLALSLSDAETGRIVWSHRAELPSILSRATTDTLVRNLVGALDNGVDFAEQEAALAKRSEDLTVIELVWRARWHINRYTRKDAAIADDLIAKALAMQPQSPDALIQASYVRAWSIWSRRDPDPQILQLKKFARRAIQADPLDSRGHMLAGMAEVWLRRTAPAQLLLNHALNLNPSLAHAYAMLGSSHYLNDQPEKALAPLETAIRLSPYDAHIFRVQGELAMANFMLGNFDAAVDYADRALIHRPGYWYAHVVRINALLGQEDLKAARSARAELKEIKPNFAENYFDWLPFVDRSWPNRLKDGLHQSE
jgi:TolB-like protein